MEKKKIAIIISIIVALIMLVPIPNRLKDGGSVEYKAILYKVTHVKKLTIIDPEAREEYMEGTTIEIFGKEIYSSVE